MLSVGRELNINQKAVSCRACAWEGEGVDLSTGLLPVVSLAIYVYSYRCPSCGSFNITRKAKLLQFRLPFAASHDNQEPGCSTSAHTDLDTKEGKTRRW
jgi:predicted RNA-binding Zn-ribbon protein involved in translation (DUF1610 family)